MAEIRIDPPRKNRTPLDAARDIARFVANPVTNILGKATDSTRKEDKEIYGTLPIIVDTTSGLLSYEPIAGGQGRGRIVADQRNAHARDALRVLQSVYDTGSLPSKVPVGYQAAAQIVAQLHHTDPPEYLQRATDAYAETVANRQPRAQPQAPPQESTPWETEMGGYIPPGGMAGFSQMTSASKLALTRLRKSSGSGRRSRKRRKSTAKRKKTTRRSSRKTSRRRKLVKGSAAAKRFMANLRKKRK